MEDKNFTFKFNKNEINFSLRGDGFGTMVNATEMCKPFNKQPSDWLRQKSSKELIDALISVRGIPRTQLVVVIQGNFSDGRSQGTWIHEDLAIHLAQWCNPLFGVVIELKRF